jgi:hypothetical protein
MKSKKKRSLFFLIYSVFSVSLPIFWLYAAVAMSVLSAGVSIYQGYKQHSHRKSSAVYNPDK